MAQINVIKATANDDEEERIGQPAAAAQTGSATAMGTSHQRHAEMPRWKSQPQKKHTGGRLVPLTVHQRKRGADIETLPLGTRSARQSPRTVEPQRPDESQSRRNDLKNAIPSLPVVESFAETLSQLSSARRLGIEIEWIQERQLCLTGKARRLTLDFHDNDLPFDCLMITPLADTPRPGRQPERPGLIARCLSAIGFGNDEDDVLDPIQVELRQRARRRKPATKLVPFDHDRLGGPALMSGTYIDRDRKRKWFFELYASDRGGTRRKPSPMSERSAKRALRAALTGLEFALRRRH